MSYLVRKISRAKWNDCDKNVEQLVTADAVTNCLKTTKNTLSVWFAEQEKDIVNAKLALLATLERFDSVDFVVLNTADLDANELKLIVSDGDTIAKPLIGLHRDISTFSLKELEKVAKLVQEQIIAGGTKRVMKKQFLEIIQSAITDKIINLADLPEKMAAGILQAPSKA